MKKILLFITFCAALLNGFAQNGATKLSSYQNPYVTNDFSVYKQCGIGLGTYNGKKAQLHVKGENALNTDTAFLVQNGSGVDKFFTMNDGTTVISPIPGSDFQFSGTTFFHTGGGIISPWTITSGTITLDYVKFNTTNSGGSSSNPENFFNANYNVGNGTTPPATPTGGMAIFDAKFIGTVTSITDLYSYYVDASAVTTAGKHYAFYSTGGLIRSGGSLGIGTDPAATAHILSTTEQLRTAYDASNYTSYTVNSVGALTVNAVGTTPQIILSDRLTLNNPDATQVAFSLNANAAQSQRIFEIVKGSDTFLKIGSTGKCDISRNAADATPVLFVANQNASFTDILQGWLTGSTHVADLNYQGRFITYDSKTTANRGAAVSIGTPLHLTGQTAATALTTVYTADADGWYRVTVQGAVTTSNAGTTLGPVTVQYTNVADNVAKTVSAGTVNNYNTTAGTATTNSINVTYTVYAKSGTVIRVACAYTGPTMAYSLDATVEQL